LRISKYTLSSHYAVAASSFDQIRRANTTGESVCLVTFNYDLLLDRALLSMAEVENLGHAKEGSRMWKRGYTVNIVPKKPVPAEKTPKPAGK
jgi:hypothetical protein